MKFTLARITALLLFLLRLEGIPVSPEELAERRDSKAANHR